MILICHTLAHMFELSCAGSEIKVICGLDMLLSLCTIYFDLVKCLLFIVVIMLLDICSQIFTMETLMFVNKKRCFIVIPWRLCTVYTLTTLVVVYMHCSTSLYLEHCTN